MVKSLFFALVCLFFTACGKHESENFGFIKTEVAEKDDAIDSPAEKIKVSIDTGDREAFEALLNENIDVNIVLEEGQTALIYATIEGRDYFVFLLMKKGADTTLIDSSGQTALQYAVKLERVRIQLLLDPSQQAALQEKLIETITNDSDEVFMEVSQLLAEGADPNFVHATGETPLTLAIQVLSNSATALINWRDEGFEITATNLNLPNAAGLKPLAVAKTHSKQKHNTIKKIISTLTEINAEEN